MHYSVGQASKNPHPDHAVPAFLSTIYGSYFDSSNDYVGLLFFSINHRFISTQSHLGDKPLIFISYLSVFLTSLSSIIKL